MDKFTRMIMNARKADIDAIRELKDYIYEESGVANKALRSLEKAGITEYAYGRAYTFLQTEYQTIKFPQAVAKRPVEDMITQALELHKFLRSPTHTVRGAKAARAAQMRGIESLNKLGYNITTNPTTLSRISKMLGTDGLRFSGTIVYELMEAIGEALDNGVPDKEVQLIIDRYATGEIMYDRIYQELEDKKKK